MKKTILKQWLRIILGLSIFSFGVHLTIFANIGLAPWDCLSMGISYHTPLNYGTATVTLSIIIVCIDLLLRERIGFGTVFDALLVGFIVQAFNDLNPLPLNSGVLTGIPIMLVGFVFMAIGQWLYMSGAQCCGPRDALLVGLGKRLPKLPIGVVEVLLWALVVFVGWLLGGPVGIGTLISVVGAGLVMQAVLSIVRFEPRSVRNRDCIEVIRILFGNEPTEEDTAG
ncbi:MAG: hypothetical protein IJQ02_01095 [Oscillospiraceae bacterium]|nr:hypothetical protein [Oscillospiraceae bacterium]